MRGVMRPCLEHRCPRFAATGKSRCKQHQLEHDRTHVGPSQQIVRTSRWKKLRARLIRERRRADKTWLCGICGRAITDVTQIEVDHIVLVSVDPSRAWDESNLRLAHRTCNRRRPRPRAPKPGSEEWRVGR